LTSHYQYPYDPTGENPLNVVTDLPHPLTPVQGKGYSLIVPKAGPFFKKDFKLVHKTSGAVLTPDVDYVFTHLVLDLSQALQKHIYGSVTVVNQRFMGEVVPIYRTVGGELALDDNHFAEYAIHLLEADGAYPWDKLKNIPTEFPVDGHKVPIETTAGYDDLVAAVKGLGTSGDHMHDIQNIRHLDDRLRNKLDANGSYKVLSNAKLHVQNVFTGTIQCRLPKVKTRCLIRAKLQITDGSLIKTLEVSGEVKPYNDGVIPEQWAAQRITPSYTCWNGDVYLSYDSEHYPTVFLGNNEEWNNAHIAIIEYFTVNPDEIEGELSPFRVSIASSFAGLQYTNTNDAGLIMTPQDTVGELSNVVNRRYYGVMPEGIYYGFSIVQTEVDKIRVGNVTERSSAVIYEGEESATVVLNKQAQILTVANPQFSAIVLELVPLGQVGDPRFKVDLPDREAQIRLVDTNAVTDNMLVIGEINWPHGDPELTVDHLSYNNRQNAQWDAGVITPITSDVVYQAP
tara:strand:- start:179852 stop:181387 length:1536 start_codon:yes stop_codon:yes gene_type:complete